MLTKLLIGALLLAPAVFQTQNNKTAVTPPPGTANNAVAAMPPIKMGLWEATITTASSTVFKTRSCVTAASYQQMLTRVPPNCTISNLTNSGTSISGDVSCTSPGGAASSGHVDVQIPDSSTAHSTITATMNYQGHTMSMVIKGDSHFVSTDCGDIPPGQTRDIE